MKPTKSKGHDEINMSFIKDIGSCVAELISILINKSLETGHVPTDLKIAKIIPVYKAKEHNLFTNYRPISLLPILSKILEKVMHSRVYSCLKKNNILYKHQYGFQKGCSTIDAVTQFVHDTPLALDNN